MPGSGLRSSLSTGNVESINAFETTESSSPTHGILPTVGAALLVGIGYYVGTRIGFAWTPSGQPNSTFWPPNAILLAALLLTPPRAWWIFILAALPAHMFAQLQTGVPAWTAVAWFVTNCVEALIGAYFISRLSGSSRRLDGVRGVLVFVIFGVIFAPLATSFLDAAAVIISGWGRNYWHLGLERFWTNALAELTIVPAIVVLSSNGISWIRKISMVRWAEVFLLALGTVLVGILVFGLPSLSPATTPALLYVPLPFLLWAAARFDLGGLSVSLLFLALISTWFTMHGRAPFPYASLPQNILSLQILFCTVAVPLMFLAAVMAEARRGQESLRRISGRLIEAHEEERSRIALELHDDFSQRMALLQVRVEQFEQGATELSPTARQNLNHVAEIAADVSSNLHDLSHRLHPSKLDVLGLVPSLTGFCKEFSESHQLPVYFVHDHVQSQIPKDVALCMFRIVQEAVRNAAKHSGAAEVNVELSGFSDRIELCVSDSGVGFDPQSEKGKRGLGLLSMSERLRLIGGDLTVESEPSHGTRIWVRVPLPSTNVL
ncbi:MAG TPA: MASE1 domain-containing protein [Candidatus Acidoferrum sp.]|jgi:signal transduction histidine kinase